MIKAIIFDCFGVLTDDAWHAFRLSLPLEQGKKAQELNHRYDEGLIDHQTFLSDVSAVTGHSKDFVGELVGGGEQSKNTPLLHYIGELKKHYKIGLLSNVANNWIRDYFLTPEEQRLFGAMIFSFQAGVTKPDPRVYHLAAERLGVKPEECVFIDDIDRYVAAAQQEGMSGITYKDFDQMKADLEKILDATT